MMLKIEYAPAYLKKARKLAKINPQLKKPYTSVLERLTVDPFDPLLHTHPLTGKLKGKYACSLTFELRIIFMLYDDIVRLLDIGSHDQVY